ncbi:MAG: hypothetical protein A2Y25_03215 [Candidatus Melainabacteria bacterium GWF2_37_15]|nr:MAG: hypothetical protein A2Y25_03215 [Candidatus Melainabacteria bacterium GWF2_37_15]
MPNEDFQEGYEILRKNFALKLKDKLAELISAEKNHKELYQIVHNVSGSCGMFGFPEISEAAYKLEENLKASRTLLTDLINEMEKEL